jgi:predicted CXXCH cytochrome family protein
VILRITLHETLPMKNPTKPGLMLSCLLWLMLALSAPGSLAADVELDAPELACLKCHDKEGLKMKTQKGEVLPLSISTKAFIDSMHNKTSCEDCHDDLDEKEHGKKPSTVSSKREFTLKMSDTCVSCHKENVALFKDTVHAAMINGGSDKAASCSDCHNSHTVKSVKIISPIDQIPCARCHEDIFKAYAKDVHGLERIAKGKDAPTCNTCHSAHEIKAASFGDALKDSCIKCHKDSASSHEKWLPNSALHFEAVSCAVCHAPDAQRRVNLRMVDSVGGKQLQEQRGVPKFESLIKTADGKEVGLDEKELRSFLKAFNLESDGPKAILSGRLEVRSGVQAHQLTEKEKAIKDCKVCHQYGAAPFQTVVLTMAGPDGRPMRHGVEKEILSSLTATGTMKGFYAIGSTRVKMLDYLLVLVLLGVACVPIAHLTANRLFKAKRDQLKAASNKDQS